MKQWIPSDVQAYAGYRGEESPRRFSSGQTEYLVGRILWQTNELTSDHRRVRRFLVSTRGGEEFMLLLDVETWRWYVELDV